MEPMDTTVPIDAGIMRYEVVSTTPRSEPMISGAVGGFTISAPNQAVPTFVQMPVPPNPTSRAPHTDFPADVNPGFSLSDFLSQLEDYTPTVPDTVSNYYLHLAGFDSSDPRMGRLISLATQKFLSDIINEAFTHCKLKGSVPVGKGNKKQEKKFVLTMEDLVPILNDYGITVKKPMYYT